MFKVRAIIPELTGVIHAPANPNEKESEFTLYGQVSREFDLPAPPFTGMCITIQEDPANETGVEDIITVTRVYWMDRDKRYEVEVDTTASSFSGESRKAIIANLRSDGWTVDDEA